MTSENPGREPRLVPRVTGVIGKFAKAAEPVDLPAPQPVDLADRGRTCVIDAPGPSPDAPVVILLHALATTAALSWYPSIQALTQHYRVIAFDQRWHGRGIQSDHFRIADCADDVVAVADALGVEKFMLVGYSMGGAVAQMTWKRHRDRVEGLVLAATARNFRGKMTERLWFSMTAAAMNKWSDRARTGMLKVASALSDQPTGLSAAADRIAPWAMAEFRSTSAWSIFAALDEVGRFDSATWINRVDVPTSVIVATRDRFIPTRRQRRLAASIPGAMTYDVEGNHAAIVLGADDFVPVLVAACRSVTRRLERRPAA